MAAHDADARAIGALVAELVQRVADRVVVQGHRQRRLDRGPQSLPTVPGVDQGVGRVGVLAAGLDGVVELGGRVEPGTVGVEGQVGQSREDQCAAMAQALLVRGRKIAAQEERPGGVDLAQRLAARGRPIGRCTGPAPAPPRGARRRQPACRARCSRRSWPPDALAVREGWYGDLANRGGTAQGFETPAHPLFRVGAEGEHERVWGVQ